MLTDWARFERFQWSDRNAIRRHRDDKLRTLVDHAYGSVPYYRALFDGAAVDPASIRTPEDLPKIPVSTKKDFQAAGLEATTSSTFRLEALASETTSGSTGRPFTLVFDRRWKSLQRGLFLRALTTAGYRPGRRIMMLTGPGDKRLPSWSGWRHVSFDTPPRAVLEEMERFRPHIVYGWVTPLRALANQIAKSPAGAHTPRAVVTTAEGLDHATRQTLRSAFRAEVFDVYGLTELGVVAWECAAHDGYHLAEDASIVEFLPLVPGGTESRLVMTNLEMRAMPLIRYDPGDLGVAGSPEPCTCGRKFARLSRVDGRAVDCLRLEDGRTVSPYEITLALEGVAGLDRYQVVQNRLDELNVRFESSRPADPTIAVAAVRAIRSVVGERVKVEARREVSLDPLAGRKFRVVDCRLAVDVAP